MLFGVSVRNVVPEDGTSAKLTAKPVADTVIAVSEHARIVDPGKDVAVHAAPLSNGAFKGEHSGEGEGDGVGGGVIPRAGFGVGIAGDVGGGVCATKMMPP